jgi:hypothetical protein
VINVDKDKEKEVVEAFVEMCEESINPDLYSTLVDEIIPAIESARHIEVSVDSWGILRIPRHQKGGHCNP